MPASIGRAAAMTGSNNPPPGMTVARMFFKSKAFSAVTALTIAANRS